MADLSQLYVRALRPLLFKLDPERAHALALRTLRVAWPWRVVGSLTAVRDPRLRVDIGGLKVANPVGLAPGVDKNGAAVRAIANLGFGYIVIGSLTRDPRAGNPRPRLLRDPANEAIVNSLGLPGVGLVRAIEGLRLTGSACP